MVLVIPVYPLISFIVDILGKTALFSGFSLGLVSVLKMLKSFTCKYHRFGYKLSLMPHSVWDLDYFLQVVREDEAPVWPRDENELVIGSQPLPGSLIQYWAYPKGEGKDPNDPPKAEILASEHPAPKPAILINQVKGLGEGGKELELILVKNGHAYAQTLSSLSNLEDNIGSILDLAKKRYDLSLEHFMTTSSVSPKVEEILDNLEKGEEKEESVYHLTQEESEVKDEAMEIPHLHQRIKSATFDISHSKPHTPHGRPQITITLPVFHLSFLSPTIILIAVLIFVLGGGLILGQRIFNKNSLSNKLSFLPFVQKEVKVETIPTISPTHTPTPVPGVIRSKYQVRVLNGSSKAGAAGVLGNNLESRGWQINKVGNYINFSNTQTFIKAKDGLSEAAKALVEDLKGEYEATISGILKEDDSVDLEVVIGRP